jgi:surfeit locus 1 family protein
MYARWKAAGLISPAIMTLAMLPVLIGLGTWQWHRKAWKEDLIAKIAARVKAEPVSYTVALRQYVQTGDVEYLRVQVTGTFDHNNERHLYAPTPSSQGWHIYARFIPEGGQPPMFVNRGWVPDTLKDPAKRIEGQVAGPTTVQGLLRLPERAGSFKLENDAKSNRWYVRDAEDMEWNGLPPGKQMVVRELGKMQHVAPFTLDAEAEPANPGGWPKGGTTEIHIPNRHLEYVLTWYGFALTLLVIFAVFARQRLATLDNKMSGVPPKS